MIKIEETGEYKLLYFREKWNDVSETLKVEKKGLFGSKKTTKKKYAKTGLTAWVEKFPLQEGDIIIEAKYYGGYYKVAVLRKIIVDIEVSEGET